jgi:hypothetical protein
MWGNFLLRSITTRKIFARKQCGDLDVKIAVIAEAMQAG